MTKPEETNDDKSTYPVHPSISTHIEMNAWVYASASQQVNSKLALAPGNGAKTKKKDQRVGNMICKFQRYIMRKCVCKREKESKHWHQSDSMGVRCGSTNLTNTKTKIKLNANNGSQAIMN